MAVAVLAIENHRSGVASVLGSIHILYYTRSGSGGAWGAEGKSCGRKAKQFGYWYNRLKQ